MTQMSFAIGDGSSPAGVEQPAATATKGAVLHCDLAVDPAREAELIQYFHDVFRPVAETFAGFRELKILKLTTMLQGEASSAPGAQYRFHLCYESEALRQVWSNSPEHAALWPTIENALMDKGYPIALYDEA
jgi:heme-degrading monooxygenase HmoA